MKLKELNNTNLSQKSQQDKSLFKLLME